ncbi:MAG: hypothetical protein JNL92_10515 [Opitutaceae bacterium]|nr:hypothetical protein [Opitutaceae bacterium]
MATPATTPPRRQTPLINAGLGAGALLLGLLVIGTADTSTAAALKVLPVVDARGLAAQEAGATVLVEGRVATGQPALDAGLVVLQRQHAVGATKPGSNEIRFTWEPLPAAQQTGVPPALVIESGTGAVTLVNQDFVWRDPPRVASQPTMVVSGSTRVAGFAAGDAITVRATVVDAAQARLRAIEVFGGTHANYLRSVTGSARVPWVIGGGFALLGAALLISAFFGWRTTRL